MASVQKLPTVDKIRELVDEGLTNVEIAQRYGVTAEAVRITRKNYALPDQVRVRADHSRYLPWRLRADHTDDLLARNLRSYSRLKQGIPLRGPEERRIREWLAFMDGDNPGGVPLSVHYDRRDAEGFWLEPRQPGDRDYISPPAKVKGGW